MVEALVPGGVEGVGRADELARLLEVARQACSGSPPPVLITAPAGIGKSELVDRLRRRVAGSGAETMTVVRAVAPDEDLSRPGALLQRCEVAVARLELAYVHAMLGAGDEATAAANRAMDLVLGSARLVTVARAFRAAGAAAHRWAGGGARRARVPSRRADPGGPARAGPISGPPRWADGLTDREREITSLVGRGWTNPEIAAELSVSPKTVEYHLRNVYGKLGVSDRRALRDRVQQA